MLREQLPPGHDPFELPPKGFSSWISVFKHVERKLTKELYDVRDDTIIHISSEGEAVYKYTYLKIKGLAFLEIRAKLQVLRNTHIPPGATRVKKSRGKQMLYDFEEVLRAIQGIAGLY